MKLALIPWLFLAAGCGSSQDGDQAEGNQENAASSSGNPVTAPVDYLGAVASGQKSVQKTTSLVGIKQAIQMFQVQEGRLPKSLDELVGSDYMPKLPDPPPQMKFDYDPATGTIRVVPQ